MKSPCTTTRESPRAATKTQCSQKQINKQAGNLMRHQKGFLRNSGKGKKRTYWKRCFFFRYMVYLHETHNSEDSFADMKGSHLEVEADAAKSWADIGRVAGSLRNCQVTKSVPSWSLSIFGISSFMNHQPWLLLFKPFWVNFSLSPNRKSQLT